jgi:hypothetical protein
MSPLLLKIKTRWFSAKKTTNTAKKPEENTMQYTGFDTDVEINAQASTGDALPSDWADEMPACVMDGNTSQQLA